MINLTIRELIKNEYVNWKNVKRALKYHYPGDKSNYENLFYKIGKMKKSKVKDDEYLDITVGMDITCEYFETDDNLKKHLNDLKVGDEIEYYGIGLYTPNDKKYKHYSVSFIPWSKMVNLKISDSTLKHYTFLDIVAHFLWEITFYGDEKKMKKTASNIQSAVKDIKKK